MFNPAEVLRRKKPVVVAPPPTDDGDARSENDWDSGSVSSLQTDTDINDGNIITKKLQLGMSSLFNAPASVSDMLFKILPRSDLGRDEHMEQSDTESLAPPPSNQPAAPSDDEVLESLPQEFFENEPFDAAEYVISHLAQHQTTAEKLEEELRAKERCLDIVTSRLCKHVMDHSSAFVEVMSQIQRLETDLLMTTVLCRNSRRSLHSAEVDLTSGGLQILSKYRRKKKYLDIIEVLSNVRTLKESEAGLTDALERGDYILAVRSANAFKQIKTEEISGVSATKQMIARATASCQHLQFRLLDQVEAAINDFKPTRYESLLRACVFYSLSDTLVATLRKKFQHLVVSKAASRVHAFLSQSDANAARQLKESMFRDNQEWLKALSARVSEDILVPCLQELFGAMASVMFVFAQVVKVHQEIIVKCINGDNVRLDGGDDESPRSGNSSPRSSNAANAAANAAKSKSRPLWNSPEELEQLLTLRDSGLHTTLVAMRLAVWEWVQSAVCTLLTQAKLPPFKVEGYLNFLNCINDLVVFGERFIAQDKGDRPPCALHSLVATKTKSVFESWHRENLELVKVVIENEQWTKCPLTATFSFQDMKELRFDRSWGGTGATKRWPENSRQQGQGGQSLTPVPDGGLIEFIADYEAFGNPWDESKITSTFKISDPVAPERVQSNGTVQAMNAGGAVITTGASLNVVKFLGRYSQIMEAIPVLGEQCFQSFQQMAFAYINSVFTVFNEKLEAPTHESGPTISTQKMSASVKKGMGVMMSGMTTTVTSLNSLKRGGHKDSIATTPTPATPAQDVSPLPNSNSFVLPAAVVEDPLPLGVEIDSLLKPQFKVTSPNTLFGLAETAIAAKSLQFVQFAVQYLDPYTRPVLPQRCQSLAEEFLSQFRTAVDGVTEIIYHTLASRLINTEAHTATILSVKWDEIRESNLSENNKYIEDILTDLRSLRQRMSVSSVPSDCVDKVWRHVIIHIMESLVDAYSKIKKCGTNSPTLMGLDLEVLKNGIREIVPLKTIPYLPYVENFIRAHYYIEQELFDWIELHPEYRLHHLHALVNNLPVNLKRKARSDLIQRVSSTYSNWNPGANSWNEFQKLVANQGMTKSEVRYLYYRSGFSRRNTSSWEAEVEGR